jgi:hypothetical protein
MISSNDNKANTNTGDKKVQDINQDADWKKNVKAPPKDTRFKTAVYSHIL